MSTVPLDRPATESREAPRPVRPGTHPVLAGVYRVLNAVASLKITVGLFVLATLLVFFGTLAQKNSGIWTVIDQYFWSWGVWVEGQLAVQFCQVFFGLSPSITLPSWVGFPLPGGKLLGFLMMGNLVAAHVMRFRAVSTYNEVKKGFAKGGRHGPLTLANVLARRGGTWAIHLGLILLFVGEIGTRLGQVEQRMTIPQGQAVGYAVDSRKAELAFVDRSKPDVDSVAVVPESLLKHALKTGERIRRPGLPYDVAVEAYYVNSDLRDDAGPAGAVAGGAIIAAAGLKERAIEKAEGAGVGTDMPIDMPSAYVTLYKPGTDDKVGTYLVSLLVGEPQPIDNGPSDVALRFARYYKPFTLYLHEFRFDRYAGTNTPRNYSSRLQLVDPELGEDYEVLVRMNEPLRHRGETFYQSNFDKTETTTVLQVVRNPVAWMPYAACVVVTAGMLMHFLYFFVQFLARTLRRGPAGAAVVPADRPAGPTLTGFRAPRPTPKQLAAAAGTVVVAAMLYYGGYVMRTTPKTRLDLSEVAALPVLDDGRIKPLGTYARAAMRILNHSEQYVDKDGQFRPAVEWFMDMATSETPADRALQADIFRVENLEVKDLLRLPKRKTFRYSLAEVAALKRDDGKSNLDVLRKAAAAAEEVRKVDSKKLTLFQAKVLELSRHVSMASAAQAGAAPALLPPADGVAGEFRAAGRPDDGLRRQREQQKGQVLDFMVDYLGIQPKTIQELQEAAAKLPPAEQDRFRAAVTEFTAGLDAKAQAEDAARAAADPAAAAWWQVLAAYRANDQAKLDAAVSAFRAVQTPAGDGVVPAARLAVVRFEERFNRLAPFFHLLFGCLSVAMLTAAGWGLLFFNPGLSEAVRRTSFWVMVALFVGQTAALVARMYLSDRWFVFVTNLYSSALFISWGAMGVGLIVERLFPLGLGNMVGAVVGALGGFIAHNLADGGTGDTLGQLEAVLDTNIWLATHVTTVTFGYAATFVAGFIGVAYLALDVTSNALERPMLLGRGDGARRLEVGRVIGMLLYGVICFATLLSFVGTVLGGIWADQSWGRFWGWDPKENGAVMIVVWNALILHARWGGLVKDRGVAALAVAGNMVVTWSWFGTNQLGVGLHAYGFDNTLATGCVVAWAFHAAVIAAAVGTWGYDRAAGRRG